ncbi:MlaD family protein [Nocardia sp. NPDC046473]|uniref:MlaD family protein n=1 Tax=Nocardia sp. NPDC046473 TaxID=3155733 RepID=UPI0033E914F9
MSSARPLIWFGAFALTAVLVTVLIWNTLARTVDGDTFTYAATFTNVQGLRTGDDVRIAGVRVGKVEQIGLDEHNHARVRFIVQRDQLLYNDTKVLVRYQNLIGQRYLALAPGATDDHTALKNKAAIPVEHTEGSFDISGLLNGFQPLFSVLEPEHVNRLSQTLVQALQGDRVSLAAFITQAAALAGDFQRRDTILADIITNLSSVMAALAARGDELETLVTQTRALIGGLYDQGQSLQQSTARLAESSTALVGLLDRAQPSLRTAQTSTLAALTLLLDNGTKLDQALLDLTTIVGGLGKVSSEGGYSAGYFCGIDISLYGVLFPRGQFAQIGGTAHSPPCRP